MLIDCSLVLPSIGLMLELAIRLPFDVLHVAGTSWIVKGLHGPCSSMNRQMMIAFANVLNYWLDDSIIRHRAQLHLVLQVCLGILCMFRCMFSKYLHH
jgi:hypothetical protein